MTNIHRQSPEARRRTSVLWALALAALPIVLLLPGDAAAEEGLTSIRSAGMGDNNIATVTGNGAVFHNPAGLAGSTLYSLEVGYDASFRPRTHRIGVSVADSKTNDVLAAGFAYTFSIANNGEAPYERRIRDHDLRLAVAVPIIPERLSLGATGTYLKYAQGEGDDREEAKGFSVDLGLMAKITDSLFVGFSAQDLAYVQDGTGRRKLRTGVGAFIGPVQLNAQWRVDIDGGKEEVAQHRFGAGAEVNIEGALLRAGYQHLFANSDNVLSVGAGYRSETFGVDAVYRQYFNLRDQREFGISVSLFL